MFFCGVVKAHCPYFQVCLHWTYMLSEQKWINHYQNNNEKGYSLDLYD